jgi:hypothetical protein
MAYLRGISWSIYKRIGLMYCMELLLRGHSWMLWFVLGFLRSFWNWRVVSRIFFCFILWRGWCFLRVEVRWFVFYLISNFRRWKLILSHHYIRYCYRGSILNFLWFMGRYLINLRRRECCRECVLEMILWGLFREASSTSLLFLRECLFFWNIVSGWGLSMNFC